MSAKAPLLEMEGIYKTFPGVVANDHIDLTVREGEVHGLLGENGAGKSTLMKVLFGLYDADDGSVRYDGEVLDVGSPKDAIDTGLGMVHQHFQLIPKLSVAENVVLGLRECYGANEDSRDGLLGSGPVRRLRQLLSYNETKQTDRVGAVADEYGIDIDPEKKVGALDVGERQRVEILKALYRDADLLVLDEPTAVLTPNQIDRLFDTLRSLTEQGLTIIIITHKLNEVTDITDRVTVLREGKRIDTVETERVTESELARLMVGREVIRDIEKTSASVGDTVLTASDVHATDDRGVEVLSGVDLTVREGEILGLAGVSGNGQRELTDCILGKREITDGSMTLDGATLDGVSTKERVLNGLSIVPSDRHEAGCAPELSLVHNSVTKDYRSEQFGSGPLGIGIDYGAAREHAECLLEEYDVRAPNADVAAGNLSGGNLQKLILGRELDRDPSLLIANQPTRGLDVGAVESVRQRLLDQRKQGTGILLVSEKLNEIMELSDRIAVIYEGEIVHETDGETADRGDIGVYMSSGTEKATEPAAPETTLERVRTGSSPN
jgi:simple sugar transport system ATP-binding protein